MKISIITVVKNDSEHLEQTIQSVLSQTYSKLEYIIIDGGSNDGTIDIIKKYSDKITYWVSEPDKGVYDAMNKAIAASTGDYVNFMNSGDTFHDKNVLSNMRFDEIAFGNNCFYGDVNEIQDDGIHRIKPKPFFETSLKFLGIGICHQTMFFPGDVIRRMKYDLQYRIVSDYDLAYRMYKEKVNFVYRDVLVADCSWGEGISSDPFGFIKVYKENVRVCKQQWHPLYWVKLALEFYRLQKKKLAR